MIYNEKWLSHLRESKLSKLDKIDLKDLQNYYIGEVNRIYKEKLIQYNKSQKRLNIINQNYENLKKKLGIKRGGLKPKSNLSRKQLEYNITELRREIGYEGGATIEEKKANLEKSIDKAYESFKRNDKEGLYSDYHWTKAQFTEYIAVLDDLYDRLPNHGSTDVGPIADLYMQQSDHDKKRFLDYVAKVSNQMQGQGQSPYMVTEQILKNWIP